MHWWEKTVEYKYIADCAKEEDLLSPFDGKHERAGDAGHFHGGMYSLIEFKRDSSYYSGEKDKYIDYFRAKRELEDYDSFHFIVYGEEVNKFLNLRACTYFSDREIEVGEIRNKGTDLSSFESYVQKLVSYKKKKKEASGSGGFGSVAVINRSVMCPEKNGHEILLI